MSLSILQLAFTFLTFLSFSNPIFVTARTSESQLKEACNNPDVTRVMNPDLCLKILQSDQKIISTSNEIDFAIAVIESGISNGTNTRTYVEKKLNETKLDPNLKAVFQECKLSYDSAIVSLESALGEVKIGEYQTSTYDLMIASTDNINRCKNVVASKKVEDATILVGNRVLPMFGNIGLNVVTELYQRSPPSPI